MLVFSISNIVLGQFLSYNENDTIYKVKVNLGYKYYQNGYLLKHKNLIDIFSKVPESDRLYSSSRSYFFGSVLFSAIGGFFIGQELGRKFFRNDRMKPAFLWSGIGAVALAVPFDIMHKRKLKKSIEVFNNSLKN